MNNKNNIIISGMRPTNRIHLGNYSVLKYWINLQNKYECFFFVADMHAMTTNLKNNNIKYFTEYMIIDWLACGLDPNKCKIFIQSQIPEVFELYTILSMVTPISWLKRIPAYKEKIKNNNTHGFLGYPILQAADIFIVGADYVPIGEDQLPHLEIIREIARKVNYLFNCNLIKEPLELLSEYKKILGFDEQKMSKSKNNTIKLSDDEKTVKIYVNKIITDKERIFKNICGNPEVCNVWTFHKIYTRINQNKSIYESCKKANIGCSECKDILYNNIMNLLRPIQFKINKYKKDKKLINGIINEGKKQVRIIAKKKLKSIKCLLKI